MSSEIIPACSSSAAACSYHESVDSGQAPLLDDIAQDRFTRIAVEYRSRGDVHSPRFPSSKPRDRSAYDAKKSLGARQKGGIPLDLSSVRKKQGLSAPLSARSSRSQQLVDHGDDEGASSYRAKRHVSEQELRITKSPTLDRSTRRQAQVVLGKMQPRSGYAELSKRSFDYFLLKVLRNVLKSDGKFTPRNRGNVLSVAFARVAPLAKVNLLKLKDELIAVNASEWRDHAGRIVHRAAELMDTACDPRTAVESWAQALALATHPELDKYLCGMLSCALVGADEKNDRAYVQQLLVRNSVCFDVLVEKVSRERKLSQQCFLMPNAQSPYSFLSFSEEADPSLMREKILQLCFYDGKITVADDEWFINGKSFPSYEQVNHCMHKADGDSQDYSMRLLEEYFREQDITNSEKRLARWIVTGRSFHLTARAKQALAALHTEVCRWYARKRLQDRLGVQTSDAKCQEEFTTFLAKKLRMPQQAAEAVAEWLRTGNAELGRAVAAMVLPLTQWAVGQHLRWQVWRRVWENTGVDSKPNLALDSLTIDGVAPMLGAKDRTEAFTRLLTEMHLQGWAADVLRDQEDVVIASRWLTGDLEILPQHLWPLQELLGWLTPVGSSGLLRSIIAQGFPDFIKEPGGAMTRWHSRFGPTLEGHGQADPLEFSLTLVKETALGRPGLVETFSWQIGKPREVGMQFDGPTLYVVTVELIHALDLDSLEGKGTYFRVKNVQNMVDDPACEKGRSELYRAFRCLN